MLKRFTNDFLVDDLHLLPPNHILLTLKLMEGILPEILPGQFVEIKIPDTANTFLRRPISIHDVNFEKQTITLLIRVVGNGTTKLSLLNKGESVNLVYPLGNGFDLFKVGQKPLLIGGGVGVAPLLYLGRCLKKSNIKVNYLLGVKSISDLLCYNAYSSIGSVNITTEDGTAGTKGFVTNHDLLNVDNVHQFTSLLVCGPTPMMKAVANVAKSANVPCFVSLENKMACGIGVCLCCVTDTKDGHKCVCSDGPIFDINDLKWE